MQTLYPFFLTTHLLCAIVFLGFIFTDVVLLSILRRTLGDNALQNVMKRGTKIMPICVLLLVLTGGAMMTRYLDFGSGLAGFFGTPLQTFLSVKIILALLIVCLVINALAHKFVLKKTKSTRQLHAQNRFRAGLFHCGAGKICLFCVKFKFFSHKKFALPFWLEFY